MPGTAPDVAHRTTPPERLRRKAWRWCLCAAFLVLLAACQSTQPTEAPELQPAAVEVPATDELRVRFLPPLAKGSPQGEFVAGLELEIMTFNVDPVTRVATGAALGTTLSTANRTVTSNGDVYSARWRVLSPTQDGAVNSYLRLEIRLPGGTDTALCNEASPLCLGYLDVHTSMGSRGDAPKPPAGFAPTPAGVLPLRFKVLEATAPVGGPPPATLGELESLAGGNFDESLGNCAASFLTRPGQGLQAVGAGLQAVGAVGGLFHGATTDITATIRSSEEVGAELAARLAQRDSGRNAVLLVVDDFSNGYRLPDALFGEDPDLGALAGQVSHGALVLHHLLEMGPLLVPGASWQSGQGADGQPYYYLTDGHGKKLYVQVVDVGEYDTDLIPGRIAAAMRYYGEGHVGRKVSSMVVNMSFAIVPCSVLHDFAAAEELVTFEAYLAALAVQNDVGQQYLGELDELVSSPVNPADDALLNFVLCPLPSASGTRCDGGSEAGNRGVIGSLFQVASSGNYGNAYALYPAASEAVISVGSLEASGAGYAPAAYSNSAEIAAPGGLFELSTVAGSTVAFAGTSFAAPVVSLYLAADSMLVHPNCQPGDLNGGVPPALATGAYEMLPFYGADEDALGVYCPNPG